MRYIFIPIFLLGISMVSLGQTATTYYFNQQMSIVSKKNATYFGSGTREDSLYKLYCYYMANNSLLFMAHFTDSTFHMYQGAFKSFYDNGVLESEGDFDQGKENGWWKRRSRVGKIIDSVYYSHGEKNIIVNYVYTPEGQLMSITSEEAANGRIVETNYDDAGQIVRRDTVIRAREDPVKPEEEAAFPGGPRAWAAYIQKQIFAHIGDFTEHDFGTCQVQFIVDTTGKISEVVPISMAGSKLAEVVVNAIKNGPDWIPAKYHGRIVKAFRIQPVTITNPGK
jgi:YD repeat-containing protein